MNIQPLPGRTPGRAVAVGSEVFCKKTGMFVRITDIERNSHGEASVLVGQILSGPYAGKFFCGGINMVIAVERA